MKFVNKFGIIDFIIILFIVGVVGIGANRFLLKDTNSGKTGKIEYLMESTRVTSDSDVKIGKENIYNSIKNYDMGKVVKHYKKPAKVEVEDIVNGVFRLEESTLANSVYLKVQADATITDKAIIVGDEALKVGERYPVKGNRFSAEFVVLEIKVLEK